MVRRIVDLDSYLVYYVKEHREEFYATLEEALAVAREFSGDTQYVQPIHGQHTYLFGKGDGRLACIVAQQWEVVDE